MECPPGGLRCGESHLIIPSASAAAWSADDRAIFYISRRGEPHQIWRHPLDGSPDTQVTSTGASYSRETPDGKWLYFSTTEKETIYRMAAPSAAAPTAAAVEQVIDPSIRVLHFGWDATPTDILFFEMPPKQQRWAIRALSIASGRVRYIGELGDFYTNSDGMEISVSRDGKWVYYPRLDSWSSNVVVAENVQ